MGQLGGDEVRNPAAEIGGSRRQRVAQRILEVMRRPIFVSDQGVSSATASVGVAIYPPATATVADLMRNSDVAMCSVRRWGRNASAILAGAGELPGAKLELGPAAQGVEHVSWCCTGQDRRALGAPVGARR